MSRKLRTPNRKQPVLVIDKETGEQWIYTCTSAAAEALGRCRQWVSLVINNPMHVVHKDRSEMSLNEMFACGKGKVVMRQRGGYFKYDVQKFNQAAWKIYSTGEYSDGRLNGEMSPNVTFSSLKSLANFLGYDRLHKPNDVLPKPVYSQITGEGFYIECLDTPEFKDGAAIHSLLAKGR